MPTGAKHALAGDLLEIVFCRPECRNALRKAEWAELESAIEDAERDAACEFVVIRGEGEVFCSGVDLELIEASSRSEGGVLALIEANAAILQRLERLPQFVIAALNGPAVGVGAHIALCADIILATRASYFSIPEARFGIPDVLHYQLIEQRIGRSAAVFMLMLGRRLSADDALTRGIVGEIHDDRLSLADAVADCLRRLRAVPKSVRAAFKRHAMLQGGRSDASAQAVATALALRRPDH